MTQPFRIRNKALVIDWAAWLSVMLCWDSGDLASCQKAVAEPRSFGSYSRVLIAKPSFLELIPALNNLQS